MIWATVNPISCFCWWYTASPILAIKNIINLISILTIWWCSCIKACLVLSRNGICYGQCVLLPEFCTPRPNLPVIPCISWLPTFAFQSTIMKMTSFVLVLVLGGIVCLHKIDQLQLLQHKWLRCRLGLLWCWLVFLGNEGTFCHFWGSKYCISDSFEYDGYSISSMGFLLTVIHIMVFWITFTYSCSF